MLVWREGLVAGLLGAAGVAIWFFVVDALAGTPLATPDMLGRAMLSVLGKGIALSTMGNVVAYTLFHLAAFIAVGCVVSWIVESSRVTPGALVGLLLFFAVFEVGFYCLTLFLSQETAFGHLAWYQIGAANLIAAAMMGRYLWREHPDLGTRINAALEGTR